MSNLNEYYITVEDPQGDGNSGIINTEFVVGPFFADNPHTALEDFLASADDLPDEPLPCIILNHHTKRAYRVLVGYHFFTPDPKEIN